eukprot:2391717-Rhodomonas_salina.1
MTRDGVPLTLGWCHDGRGVRDDAPVSSLMIRRAGRLGGQMLTGGEEWRRWMGLHGLMATGPNRTQIAGYADPHYVQTLDAHTSEMGYGNSGGLGTSVNGARSCATGLEVRQVDYCRAESGDHELQRVASALAEGACFRKDKTDNTILLGDVRCCRSADIKCDAKTGHITNCKV